MNLDDLQVEIRERPVAQVVTVATRLLQRRPKPLLIAWGLYSVPLFALGAALTVGLGLHPAITWLLLIALAPLFSLPLFTTVGHLIFSPRMDYRAVLATSLRRTPTFVALLVSMQVATALGLAAGIVPGIFIWRWGLFSAPIVAVEGTGFSTAFKRSRHFGSGYYGRVLLHLLNGAALLLYFSVALALLFHGFFRYVLSLNIPALGELTRSDHYAELMAMAGFSFAIPYVALIWFFAYLDLRTRKEGWDLEIAFRKKAAELERRRG